MYEACKEEDTIVQRIDWVKRGQTVLAFWLFMSLGVSSVIYGLTIPYIQTHYHLSAAVVGSLVMLYGIGRLIGSMLGSSVLARSGIRRAMFWSTVGMLAGLLAYGAAPAWWMLRAASFVIGCAFGILDVVLNAVVVTNHPGRRGLALSLLHACYGTGVFVGPFLLAWLPESGWDWRSIPWASGLLFGLGIWGWLGVELAFRRLGIRGNPGKRVRPAGGAGMSPEGGTDGGPSSEPIGAGSLLRSRVFVLAGLIGFIYQGISWGLSVWLPTLFLDVHNATPTEASRGISALFVGITVGRLLNGFLRSSDTAAYTRMLFMGSATACVSLAAALLAPTPTATLVGVFLTGIGLSIMVPLALAVITAEWPHAVGLLSGVFATLSTAGIIFWPLAFGALSDAWGFQAGLGAGVAVLFALIVIASRLHRLVRLRAGTMKSSGAS